MASKLSAKAQHRMAGLEEAQRKVDRIHGLIENFASAKQDYYAGMIARAGADVGRVFQNNGFGVMADHANQLGMAAKRGGVSQAKFRALREALGSLRGELERAVKSVIAADAEDAES